MTMRQANSGWQPVWPPGWVIVLNGAPRSGKSSIAEALAADPSRRWIVHGVDAVMAATPPALRPGIGLRPGGERPDLEDHVRAGFVSLYATVARIAREGSSVAVDVGHHRRYGRSLATHRIAATALVGIPTLIVGVRCPLEEILRRRAAAPTGYLGPGPDAAVPEPILRWQEAVHDPGIYDMEVDTSRVTAAAAADRIRDRLASGVGGGAVDAWASID